MISKTECAAEKAVGCEAAKTSGINMFSPAEFVRNFEGIGRGKSEMPYLKMLLLSILAGLLIGIGGAASNSAIHAISNVSVSKIVAGAIFPFGLIMIVLTGGELFTGNCLVTISVLSRKTTLLRMLRNMIVVYIGNFVGTVAVAACCAYFGQLNMSSGALAVTTIKIAAAKCSLPFANAFVLGILCNFLVCVAVMLSCCAKDVAGKVMGAYVPICFFVICGFEHSVANMYYISAGLFANSIDKYAALAAEAGIDVSSLTWGSFLSANLLPVTLGNLVGGIAFAVIMWVCYRKEK